MRLALIAFKVYLLLDLTKRKQFQEKTSCLSQIRFRKQDMKIKVLTFQSFSQKIMIVTVFRTICNL